MATTNPQIQKNFKLVIEAEVPQALVELIGKVQWVRCCPLCGSTHQIIGEVEDAALYTPLCQTVPTLFKEELTAWQKLYPDVASFNVVHLTKTIA